jgi:DNA-binding NarL/FixJ family response regulator
MIGKPTPPIRVLLVDDHEIVREGVQAVLENDPRVTICGEASDGAAAVERARGLRPDVILLDLVMPGPTPAETIRALKAACPTAQVLILTSFAAEDQVLDALQAGAVGYLLKDVVKTELMMAIQAAHEGKPWLHREVQRHLVARTQRPREAGPFESLTPRELSVLERIASGRSNKEIGKELNLSEGTVKGYVSAVLSKLGVDDRTQAALLAAKHGLGDGARR